MFCLSQISFIDILFHVFPRFPKFLLGLGSAKNSDLNRNHFQVEVEAVKPKTLPDAKFKDSDVGNKPTISGMFFSPVMRILGMDNRVYHINPDLLCDLNGIVYVILQRISCVL